MATALVALAAVFPASAAHNGPGASSLCTPGPRTGCPGSRLPGVDLRGRNLSSADLRRADLQGANLRHARMKGAQLGPQRKAKPRPGEHHGVVEREVPLWAGVGGSLDCHVAVWRSAADLPLTHGP